MAEAHDARELVEAQAVEERDPDFFPLNDLPNDLLVSVFEAVDDPTWVRHTFPLVCKAWNELYLTKDASPLHETLEVDFGKEVESAEAAAAAAREGGGRRDPVEGAPPRRPVVHGSRVISWAQGRAGDVRKLRFMGGYERPFDYFSPKDLGALVAVVGSFLTEIEVFFQTWMSEPYEEQFWKSLRTAVAPAARLRSLHVVGIESALLESDVEPLGQLAGSLEELVLQTANVVDDYFSPEVGLQQNDFSKSLCALTELRRLVLMGNSQIEAIPAGISSLTKLEVFGLGFCELSSLPEELVELSGLTRLDLEGNEKLGTTPESEAFPAQLGKMKSLRDLSLAFCGLRAVPAFVCELESLESLELWSNDLSSLPKELGELSRLTELDLFENKNLGDTPEDEAFPAELTKMKSLRELCLMRCSLRTVPAFVCELESLESLDLSSNYISSAEAFPAELKEMKSLRKLRLFDCCNLCTVPAFVGELESLKSLELSFCALRTVPSFVGKLKSLESLTLFLYPQPHEEIDDRLDLLIEACPRLRAVTLHKDCERTVESLTYLEAFAAKLRAKNPDAIVSIS